MRGAGADAVDGLRAGPVAGRSGRAPRRLLKKYSGPRWERNGAES